MSEVSASQSPTGTAENVLDALIEVVCACAERVSVTRSGVDRLWECHGCKRTFMVFVQEGPSGVTLAVPLFVDREAPKPPEPPEEMILLCNCGSPLRITRRLYNHRIQCPHCAARMALVLKFDAAQQKHVLDARKLDDDRTGETSDVVVAG